MAGIRQMVAMLKKIYMNIKSIVGFLNKLTFT